MKMLKVIFLVVLSTIVMSCSNNDDMNNTTPTTVQASGTVNWSAFNSSQRNITSLVTFGGQPASTYTIKTIKGDNVTFQFNIGNKSAIKARRELVFLYIGIDSPKQADAQFIESITYNADPNSQFDGNLGFTIGPDAPENYEGKFNMYFNVVEDGVLIQGEPFVVDPKITIRPSR